MDADFPYFMNKRSWYEIVPTQNNLFKIILTSEGKGIEKVVNSYNDYIKNINRPTLN